MTTDTILRSTMWRFFKAVPRVLRQQVNTTVRPSPQSIHCEEDQEGGKKKALVPISYLPWNQRWHVSVCSERADRWQYGGQRSQPNPSWTLPNYQPSFIEAVGWGSAILLGLQMSKLYNHLRIRRKKRRARREDKPCPIHWLHHIAYARNRIPCLNSGVSSSLNPSAGGDQNNGTNYPELPSAATPGGNGRRQLLDYNSLQEIDIQFEQFDCSHLQCECDPGTTYDLHPRQAEPTGQKTKEAADSPDSTASGEVSLETAMAEWCSLSAHCVAKVHHHLAFSALRRGKVREAVAQWQQACRQGDARAHFNLALCYELGKGVRQDLRKAVDHYTIAAAGGHYVAMYNLAVYYLNGWGGVAQDVGAAMGLLERAAAAGLREAQTSLAVLIVERGGSWTYAAELFISAAQKDDASAQYYLGMCYENGWGVQVDEEQAMQMYTRSAAAGHAAALHTLAVYTETGKAGLVQDREAACDLYQRAAQAGHDTATADCTRLTAQLNEERFQRELEAARTAEGPRRSKSSPVLSLSAFSFYIRDNLLDFGLDDPETPMTSPSAGSDVSVTFHIGDAACGVTICPDSGGGLELAGGGFGDVVAREAPRASGKAAKLKGSFGGFKPHSFRSEMGFLLERETKPTEMRLVACS